MNNNPNNFNTNPQMNGMNNQNGVNLNFNQPLNNIPPTMQTNNQSINNHQFDDAFVNRTQNDNNQFNQTNPINSTILPNQNSGMTSSIDEEMNSMLNAPKNKFINNNIDANSTSLNSLNVDGEYNNLPKIDYSKDPKVMENLNQINNTNNGKKNTVTIGSEGKVFIIIIIVLLLFIFVLPTIFDYLGNLKNQ